MENNKSRYNTLFDIISGLPRADILSDVTVGGLSDEEDYFECLPQPPRDDQDAEDLMVPTGTSTEDGNYKWCSLLHVEFFY